MPDIKAIQAQLRASKIDGWLFYDHHHRDPIAGRILGLGGNGMATRRWFYFIPSRGEPRKLVHRIEAGALDSLAGRRSVYSSWEELQGGLRKLLSGSRKIAMQYSPENNIPYIGLVDAGTVELVRKLKKRVVTSADLVQTFEAAWTPEQLESHLGAGKIIDRVMSMAFETAAASVRDGDPLTEFELQQWILDKFRADGLTTDEPPMAAVQPNNGNPHYEPQQGASRPIRAGDLLLLDMWGKFARPGSVYYDITWVGYLGQRVPDAYSKIFRIVREARDAAVEFVKESVSRGPDDPRMGSGSRGPRDDSQGGLREEFRSSHGPQHRAGRARQRREHGRARDARRPQDRSRTPAFRSSRASTCRSSAFAAK